MYGWASGRSTSRQSPSERWGLIPCSMTSRMASCLPLYRLRCRAVGHWLRMWGRVCRFPHSLQASERPSFFLHSARFALWGRVSCAAFMEKLRTCGGSCMTADYHISALSSVARRSCP